MDREEIKAYLSQFSMEHVLAVLELQEGYHMDELVEMVAETIEEDRHFLDNFNPDNQ